jgi:hypothetical protein
MPIVAMQMDVMDLCEQMNAMGAWLDDHRCGLSAFNCHQSSAGVLVPVVFTLAADAKAVAIRFGGRLTQAHGGRQAGEVSARTAYSS